MEFRTAWLIKNIPGLSGRQVQWWDEAGVVRPSGIHDGRPGHARMYTRTEVLIVVIVASLRARGIGLMQIRGVLRYIRQQLNFRPRWFVYGVNERALIGTGNFSRVLAMAARACGPVVIVDLQPICQLLEAETRKAA